MEDSGQNLPEDSAKRLDKRNRAHFETFIAMLVVAILFDVVQDALGSIDFVLPGLGWLIDCMISIFAWLTFYVWTSMKGWGLSDTLKQMLVNWGLPVIEFIPLLNLLPAWTLKIVLTYSFLKAEDILYNATKGKLDAEKVANYYKAVTSQKALAEGRTVDSGDRRAVKKVSHDIVASKKHGEAV